MTLSNGSSNGITAIGDDGLGQQPWWVEQWMELINGYRFKKRLERAWGYAREGHVTSSRFEGRRVHARVQGTDEAPYKVKLWLDVLNDEDWACQSAHPSGCPTAAGPQPGPAAGRPGGVPTQSPRGLSPTSEGKNKQQLRQ